MVRIIGLLAEKAEDLHDTFEGIVLRDSQDGDGLYDVDITTRCLLNFKYSQVTEMLTIKNDNFKVYIDAEEFHYFSII